MKTIKELMQWRFACQHFDAEKKISEDLLKDLLDTARLAPNSFGIQAWKFIVVTDMELRKKLMPACYNQPQVMEASALVFFCARTDLTGENGVIARHVKLSHDVQGRSDAQSAGFSKMLNDVANSKSPEELKTWLQKQVYIPVEALILAAAEKEIDSCPMEGFSPAEVAKVLELPEYIHPTVLVSLGYRNMEQPKKVRFPLEEVVEFRN
ncbi:NAD(P)H-dependent oxidoreductase [Candidatus Peregrinibacteria bacterium]|nr:NAD(P)H-dependent oxidoreductase [Candidatus Peregrinibacteria bacterium]